MPSNVLVILTTDIFGQTQWCDNLLHSWQHQSADVVCISPYPPHFDIDFQTESEAYQAFTNQGGIDTYVDKIHTTLSQALNTKINKQGYKKVMAIGFSAGAAALWKVLSVSEIVSSNIEHAIGFYPGQIRHYLDLQPNTHFSIIFPRAEKHFDLTPVIEHIVTKQNVNLIQVGFEHGYANPSSDGFNALASSELLRLLSDVENLGAKTHLLCHLAKYTVR